MLDGNECVVRSASASMNERLRRRYTYNLDGKILIAISARHEGGCHRRTKSVCETRGLMVQGDGEIL